MYLFNVYNNCIVMRGIETQPLCSIMLLRWNNNVLPLVVAGIESLFHIMSQIVACPAFKNKAGQIPR